MEIELRAEVPEGTGAVIRVGVEGSPPDGIDAASLASLGFTGKAGQLASLPHRDGPVTIVAGLGSRAQVDAATVRRSVAAASRVARGHRLVVTDVQGALGDEVSAAAEAQAVAEGLVLGLYRFHAYKSADDPVRVERLVFQGKGGARVQAALDAGARIADGVGLARDLVNEPGGSLTPSAMAEIAVEVAERENLRVTVWGPDELADAGMGGILGVNRGSDQEPRLVELVFEPERPRGRLALVGKGITFDSGGLSLKTGEGMMAMKNDMAGAAAVLGAMSSLAAVKPRCAVHAYLPLTDNMTGGDATRPGDILRIHDGTTVEVLNTDAEGRLVLADALSLASEAGPDAIVDIATLTGAVEVALGNRIAGLMGNHDGWVAAVGEAAERAGERVWPLPLAEEYRPWLESQVADLRNIPTVPRKAGTITAGLFLREFVGDGIPWSHLDIAGTSWSTESKGLDVPGGTGWGVRTLLELARGFRRPR
jgi:leucyl aminopeptidase